MSRRSRPDGGAAGGRGRWLALGAEI